MGVTEREVRFIVRDEIGKVSSENERLQKLNGRLGDKGSELMQVADGLHQERDELRERVQELEAECERLRRRRRDEEDARWSVQRELDRAIEERDRERRRADAWRSAATLADLARCGMAAWSSFSAELDRARRIEEEGCQS